ncbi:SO2930 family diheme c-type cytochrome [Kordiimonas gwangyangensis]|uniref:SO2930 family diheme c-type cytochrome n=1 Tax=Kordiimonas gwangyangensis TaxID=288022 RepID=UPI0003A8C9F7|nr:SO2930 family diheme c-type cytochrome [Kordiimonas gwangyangensis]
MFRRVLSVLAAALLSMTTIAAVARAEINDAALLAARPAKLLSEYGLFSDYANQMPAEGVVPYALITPLFTDYAHKFRFVYVPKGEHATYDAKEVMNFPVGSVLVKTFAYPADFRAPEKDIRIIETRLLIRQEKGWNAWAYVYDEELKDAVLKVAGKTLPVEWTDEAGNARSTNYVVPNKNQCKGCHTYNKEFSPIGPKARNLNMDYKYPAGSENQLAHWSRVGVLEGAPAPADAPRVPDFLDASAPVDARARAYLDVNCAHCHRLEGPASTSGLFLTWDEANKTQWGYKKRPVAAGRGSGGLDYDIMPGKPDQSILVYRLQSLDPGVMMPEVGRTMVHEEGIALLKEWIASIE